MGISRINSLYQDEIGHPELLSPENILALAQCIERGRTAAARPNQPGNCEQIEAGEQAKQRLVEANLRLVIHVARRYQHFDVDLMDLIQEGNLGLMHAADKYDYRKGARFSTYAIWWIHQAISRALLEQSQAIHIPLYRMEKIKQLRQARARVMQLLGTEPRPEDLADYMSASVEEVKELLLLSQSQDLLRLDAKENEDMGTLGETLEDDPANSPESVIIRQTLKQHIWQLLETLRPRERSIIRLRYGLDGPECSLPQTAQRTGLSPEGVRQAEQRALKLLARAAHTTGLRAYL